MLMKNHELEISGGENILNQVSLNTTNLCAGLDNILIELWPGIDFAFIVRLRGTTQLRHVHKHWVIEYRLRVQRDTLLPRRSNQSHRCDRVTSFGEEIAIIADV